MALNFAQYFTKNWKKTYNMPGISKLHHHATSLNLKYDTNNNNNDSRFFKYPQKCNIILLSEWRPSWRHATVLSWLSQ